ncbi:ATP synthase subunit I [Paenibacillus dendritiformis]|uniref:ATP synthase I n=1 Tax=Paenibacillus dendritiformis C454 TaxID=1131935 RepID=H3SQ33_9BACL|nr:MULTISPECIES: ATP synthase subunit I [Paenibacillus]EHQ58825.1 ATP synthase I [Paenibacillus dendritiformis C454]PZM62229.1 ATP synthase subunit I [Paenibacillus dendritiformis]TDL51738.1 ATP synthase subunit I [Paenibacillus dendritiformis]WGU93689.1 ATP synthase subunit I [Paenibacillus dendritiformis]WII37291.1 ATP synthase subunit I [Paenibacillus thiaminolyticus]
MNDMTSIVHAVTRVAFILMSMFLLVWAFSPEHRPYAAGLTLGTVAGLINARYLSMKVRQLAELAASQTRQRFSLGLVTRMCIVLLAVMIGMKFEQVSLVSTIVGLIFMQVVTIIVSVIMEWRKGE